MTPYYQDASVTLYLGDCRELLQTLIGDVTLADPPYGQTSLAWDQWPLEWPQQVPTASLWCFGSLRMFMIHASEFASWQLSQDVIWEKHNGSNLHADRFRRVHEQAAHFYRGAWNDIYKSPIKTADATARTIKRKTFPPHTGHIKNASFVSHGGPRLQRSVIKVHSTHGYAEHPTQKPIGILTPLIEYSCPIGGTVLVPFAGSGSELRAAKDCGRRAIGIEIDARRCQQEVLNFNRPQPQGESDASPD